MIAARRFHRKSTLPQNRPGGTRTGTATPRIRRLRHRPFAVTHSPPTTAIREDGRVNATPTATAHTSSLLVSLTDRCVQCGLCLPACPTYALDGLEAESPRGRIALVRAWETGAAAPTPAGEAHLDHCLGCRRCEAVCPAGVEYGRILTLARARQRARRRPGPRQRFAERLAAHARLRRSLMAAYRRLHPLLAALVPDALSGTLRPLPRPPAVPMPTPTAPAAAHIPTDDNAVETVAVFIGCIAGAYEAPVHAALRRLLDAIGVHAVFPDGQGCCGTLHAHAGDTDRAAALAAVNRAVFPAGTTVLTLASGCHAAVAGALDGPTVDALAFLAARADRLHFVERPERVALHLPCTQQTAARSDAALQTLLSRVPGAQIVPLTSGHGCCGAAGTQWLTDPARATRLRQPLLDALAASGATALLSANIGCRLHLGNGTTLPVHHPLVFLADRLA